MPNNLVVSLSFNDFTHWPELLVHSRFIVSHHRLASFWRQTIIWTLWDLGIILNKLVAIQAIARVVQLGTIAYSGYLILDSWFRETFCMLAIARLCKKWIYNYMSSTSLWKLGKSFNWCPWKVLDCVNFLKIWSISKSQQWRHLSALLTYCFWTSRWISKGWTCWYLVCCVGSLPIGHLHMRKWH